MRLRLSIQNSLLLALLLLSALLLVAIGLTWRAFNEVEQQQQLLLKQELPKFDAIGLAVDNGLALLDVGGLLSRDLTAAEYEDVSVKAETLIAKVNKDLAFFSQEGQSIPGLLELEINSQSLVAAIQTQLALRQQVIDNDGVYAVVGQTLSEKINNAYVKVKLIVSVIEFEAAQQSDVGATLLFSVERMEDILGSLTFIDSPTFLQQEKNQYRLLLNRLSFQVLEFAPEQRSELSEALSPLLDSLVDDVNVFDLMLNRLKLVEILEAYQVQISGLSVRLNEGYREISLNASNTVEGSANFLLKTVSSSKNNLLLFFAIFLLLVLLLFYYFVSPRIVGRLQLLTQRTMSIAEGDFTGSIDVRGDDEVSDMAKSLAYFREELIQKEKDQYALAANEKSLSTIIQNVSEGLFTVDVYGAIQSFNPACELIFDVNAKEALGKRIGQFLPEQASVFSHHQQEWVEEGGLGFVVCERHKVIANTYLGNQFTGSLSVTLIRLADNLLYSCFIRDITAEELSKQHLDALVQELSSSNADLERFAYSCSHDLQEPIRMMASFSELLRNHLLEKGKLDEVTKRYLEFIADGSVNAKQLVVDILAYSRLGQDSNNKSWVVVDDTLEQILLMVRNLLEDKNGQVFIEGGGAQLLVVPTQFKQLLMNLVVNGLKYNKSEKPTVTINVTEETQDWLISVADNGIGIEPAYQDKIFGLFTRLVSRRDYSGSGIGLSLCKKIVDKHNGTISVLSSVGEGARFDVRLPKFN